MSNNTSKYQECTFKELLDQYDRILVPMIQRDYAQGRTDKKASDVRNNLLTDIFSDKDVHFDLVFGSKEERSIDGKEMNCFIPVDGQQRLTTLFLLHLYGQKAGKTNTELNLSKFSYDTRRAASDFCKSITSEEWTVQKDKKVSDVIKDSSWFMNYWEKDPTVEGMLNMLDAIHEKCKEITDYPNLNEVTFFFFDLESNGLNENLYLKMNSRGKPLTAFENLKAKMEKVLPEKIEIEDKYFPKCDASLKDSFKAKWKYFMDRNWTEAFWDKERPENYDESITKFIVRFLAGYWAAYGTDEEQMANDLKSLNSKDSYADFIPFEPIKKVLLENAFPKLAYALTTITDNSKIKPYWSHEKEEIEVSNKSEYKILAVVFTYVLFDGDESAMRFAWNMAENTVSGYDNFIAYCKRMKEISDIYKSDIYKKERNIYKVLVDSKFDNTSEQLKEEIAKAKQILNGGQRTDGKTWEEIIIDAEKYAFFKGAIRFLFQNAEGKVTEDSWNQFDTKLKNAKEYFDGNGIKYEYKVELTKKLVIQCNDWGSQLYDKQIFNPNASTWKWLLCSANWDCQIHNILTMELEQIQPVDFNTDSNIKQYFTPLLNELPFEWMIKNIPEGRFRWSGPRLAYYKPYGREYILFDWHDFKRRKILSSIEEINTDHKIINSCFYWGWDIQFHYKGNKFQWLGNNYVRMIENFDRCEPKIKDESKDKPEEKWYCFCADNIDTDNFTAKLNGLIEDYNKSKS